MWQNNLAQFYKKPWNHAIKQRSSPQGCTVRLETSAEKSWLGGV
jgi:hypothetical protein